MLITNKEQLSSFYSNNRIWQGIPGIARTKGGKTFICFYSGNTKETFGNYTMLFRSDTNTDFGEPIAATKKEGDFRCFDPVLWIDPLDRLWYIWNVMPGEEVYASICENPDADELIWGEEFYIGRGVMMNKPIVLTSGEWLFPIAIWKTEIAQNLRKRGLKDDEVAGSYVYKSSDNGKSFVCMGMADIRNRSFDEHMVLELNNGILKMFVRTTYGIGACYSYDRGKTWSTGGDSNLGGPCSRFFISRLKSGRILLINHVNFTGRNNLTALLSEDDGKTFPYSLLLDERKEVSYPDAIECDDGYIYITYDRERGCFKKSMKEAYASAREILTAKITEEDIINGKITTEGSFLKNVVSKLGELSPEIPDPYKESDEDVAKFVEGLTRAQKEFIIERIFTEYPISCVDPIPYDMTELDNLIERFEKQDGISEKLLKKIVNILRSTPQTTQNTYPVVDKICTYVKKHFAEDFSVSDFAKENNMSVYYLSHLFKKATSISILEFRNEIRLTKAKELLINSDEPIGEIAAKCGYSNASYFTEVFSRSEKISPSEFRKYH